MLMGSCRRFRADFTPGMDHPHRRSCPACASYAAALERAAVKLPLPASLRSRLRAIPGSADGPRLPLPQVPLLDPLRDRLRDLARREPLPAWVRSSRYAVAASYVMAVLLGATVGNPVDLGRDAAGALTRSVLPRLERALEGAESQGRERLEAWQDTLRERYDGTRRSLEELSRSLRSLESLIDLQGE